QAQRLAGPRRILAISWDEREHPANVEFIDAFQAALQSRAPEGLEFYTEYLESNRFPGENQSLFLRDYIRQKYAETPLDVIVSCSGEPLTFLLKYRGDLFPRKPIVFATERLPRAGALRAYGSTGIVYVNSYARTLDLALRLHPGTQQVFVISGTMNHDKSFERMARAQLDTHQLPAPITYLTDLSLAELKERVRGLPHGSLALYVWQQALNDKGERLESREVLETLAPLAQVPLYGMSSANV